MKEVIKEIRKESWSDVGEDFGEKSEPIKVSPSAIFKALLWVVGLLLIANLAYIFFFLTMEGSILTRYLDVFFNFNGENNIPAFFSSLILFISSCLLFLIYRTKTSFHSPSKKKYWLILSIIFLFLAVDENVAIHEEVTIIVKALSGGDLSGFLHWAWVIPYFIVFLVIAAFFLPFVLSLPPLTRKLFFISGFVFVSGAVGLELIEGYVYTNYGLNHIYNLILYCLEELMEMVGVVIFIFALLDYMGRYNTRLFVK